MRADLVALVALALGFRQDDGLHPWASDRHPTDVPRRHVEDVSAGRHVYSVAQGGTMDGETCRTPLSVGMSDGPAAEQTWESNRAVRLENVGESDLINPWLSNGRNDFRSVDEIVASAVSPGMSDREKAMAIWLQEIRHRYHFNGESRELGDPVKVFNVYGYNTCGHDSMGLNALFQRAGLKAAPVRLMGHRVTQVFFDGRWNLLDGDQHSMYLLRDNETVAGVADLVRDHDLVKRSHTQGLLNPDRRANDEWEAAIYVYVEEVMGDRMGPASTTMNMVLRPGEAITWRWGHLTPARYRGETRLKYPDTIANGVWEYRPDFTRETWRKGAERVEGVRSDGRSLSAGTVVWKLRSPYVFLGGKLEVEGAGAKFSVSWDGTSWEDAGTDLDPFFHADAPPRYEYYLRCELAGDARLTGLRVVNDLQMAPRALPGMRLGPNRFVYTDQTAGSRKARISHEWVERSASRPPGAPETPSFPPDGGETEGTGIVFRWDPPRDPDGDRIVDYHFELSARADLKWPLSTNFAKLISRTADRGQAQYTLPYVGLLNPDRTYYWRVRAKDDKGVWGAWSRAWRFTPRGPAPPVEVTLEVDEARGAGVLRWKPNPAGRPPVQYRIYGSDEKGFSVSDEPYPVSVGISKALSSPFPANFLTEVKGTEAVVVGRGLEPSNSNRAYYRVVAVDERGNRSGPSDYAAAPRPFITSAPVTRARAGSEYRCRVATLRSLGDLRIRKVDGREPANFWDIETPKFFLLRGPSWLRIDEQAGLLYGVPDAPGKAEVSVTAVLEPETRKLNGREDTAAPRPWGAVQDFVIEVDR